MKRKKILLFLLTFLFGIGSYSAGTGLVCKYSDNKGGNSLNASFSINSAGDIHGSGDDQVTLKGTIQSSDEKDIDEGEPLLGWETENFGWSGLNYYSINHKCPPYAALYDAVGYFYFYVGESEAYLKKVYDAINTGNEDSNGNKILKDLDGDADGVQGWGLVKLKEAAEVDDVIIQSSCVELSKEKCELNTGASEATGRTHACVWNDEYKFCNSTDLVYVKCGNSYDIPKEVPFLISYAVTILKIATPIILIFVALITLVKAVASQKEEDIKKAQSKLIKKIIAAVIVFFVISIVQFIVLKVAETGEKGDIKNCLKCMLNYDGCGDSVYFKDGYGNCYSAKGKSQMKCKLK